MACTHKTVLLGAAGVGKSCILLRLTSDRFDPYPESTIGAAFAFLHLKDNGKRITMGIWDTAGQERYEALAPMYYRNSQVALVVYDVTSTSSFERAKKWLADLCASQPSLQVALIATKIDLQQSRTVSQADGRSAAGDNAYLEVSAKSGLNFARLREMLLECTRCKPVSPRAELEPCVLGDGCC